MPATGFGNCCVNSLHRGSSEPSASRCFLEEGSCGQKWLFPAADCMPEQIQGSEKARRKEFYYSFSN